MGDAESMKFWSYNMLWFFRRKQFRSESTRPSGSGSTHLSCAGSTQPSHAGSTATLSAGAGSSSSSVGPDTVDVESYFSKKSNAKKGR